MSKNISDYRCGGRNSNYDNNRNFIGNNQNNKQKGGIQSDAAILQRLYADLP